MTSVLILRGTRNLQSHYDRHRALFDDVIDVGSPNGLFEHVFVGGTSVPSRRNPPSVPGSGTPPGTALLQARGAWVGAACGAAVLALLLGKGPLRLEGAIRRRAGLAAGSAAGLAVLALGAVLAVPSWRAAALAKAGEVLRVSGGSSGRLAVLAGSPRFLLGHLLAGTGPEGFRNSFLPYKSEALGMEQLRDLHCLPLQSLAEGGVAGLAAFLGLAAIALRSLLRTVGDARLQARARWPAAGLLAALVAYLADSLTICHNLGTLLLGHVALGAAAGAGSLSTSARSDSDSLTAAAEGRAEPRRVRGAMRVTLAGGFLALLAATAVHGARLWRADAAILLCLTSGHRLERGGGEADLEAAIRHGRRAVELAPAAGEYHYLLASTLGRVLDAPGIQGSPRRKEAMEVALRHGEEALRLAEEKENANLELARIHVLAGRIDLAVERARAAVAVDPHFYQSRRILGLLLLEQGKVDEARREAEAVHRLGAGEEAKRLRALIEEKARSPGGPATSHRP